MMDFEIQIRFSDDAQRRPVAWYVSGDDVSQWVNHVVTKEICSEKDMQQFRFLPIPTNKTNLAPAGCLVLPPESLREAIEIPQTELPFGVEYQNLYLPIHASWSPTILARDAAKLISGELTYVWFPAVGLVAFEQADILTMADLFECGSRKSMIFDRVEPGIRFANRLTSLTIESLPDVDDIAPSIQDDIGTKSSQIEELPKLIDEKNPNPVSRATKGLRRTIAKQVHNFVQRLPATADSRTWLNSLDDWAIRVLCGSGTVDEEKRNREIDRLLHMLETDPDEGLKYAISMGGDEHRGIGAPSNALTSHSVDFRLRGTAGSADFWQLHSRQQEQLRQQYRELAERENSLGRHRRAAYIYSELLNEIASAAKSLESGNHWQDAAVLYRDKLHRPFEAAKCLERGGLVDDAVKAYVDLEKFEEAGDLLFKLNRTESAMRLYQQHVDSLLAKHDRLNASRTLIKKMQREDEAIGVLADSWPDSNQAVYFLRKMFSLLGELGRHGESNSWIDKFQREQIRAVHQSEIVTLLSELAGNYPCEITRANASGSVPVLIHQFYRQTGDDKKRRMMNSMSAIAPHDKILARDCRRFAQRSIPRRRPKASVSGRSIASIEPVRTVQLHGSEGTKWCQFVRNHDTIYGVGNESVRVQIARIAEDGFYEIADISHRYDRIVESTNIVLRFLLFAGYAADDGRLVASAYGYPGFDAQHLFGPNNSFDVSCELVGGVFELGTIGAIAGPDGEIWMIVAGQTELLLKTFDKFTSLTGTHFLLNRDQFTRPGIRVPNWPIGIAMARSSIHFAIDDKLFSHRIGRGTQTTKFESPVFSIASSPFNTKFRIAIGLKGGGGRFICEDFGGRHESTFAHDMEEIIVCINRGGFLIAANEFRAEIFQTYNNELQLVATTDKLPTDPVNILPCPNSRSFAICGSSGEICYYEI